MTETGRATLSELLILRYEDFRRRLARRLGSNDLARESLHETYLQLTRVPEPAAVHSPDSYLFRIALNMAASLRRVEARQASPLEIETAINFVDETARPEQAAGAVFDLERLEQAIRELPPRRRAIFLAVRVEGQSIQTITDVLGLSRRSVELELKRAIEHCAKRLGRPVTRRFGPKAPESSIE